MRHSFTSTPTRRVTPLHYLEEWGWWQASRWQLVVESIANGGLLVYTYRKRNASLVEWAVTVSPGVATRPAAVRRLLTELLYSHLYPAKSRSNYLATGQVCSEQELMGFIQQQRRA